MAQGTPGPTDYSERVLAKVRKDYRLGLALLLAGIGLFVACAAWAILLGGPSMPSYVALVSLVLGSIGLGFILSGTVFFSESRNFLRQNDRSG